MCEGQEDCNLCRQQPEPATRHVSMQHQVYTNTSGRVSNFRAGLPLVMPACLPVLLVCWFGLAVISIGFLVLCNRGLRAVFNDPQVLPLMESFFVLADARIAHMPVPEGLVSRANSIVELSRESSVPMELMQAPTQAPEASAGASSSVAVPATVRSTPQESRSTTPERQALDVHMPFLRCA